MKYNCQAKEKKKAPYPGTFPNQSTESTAGRAYMQRYKGWLAQILELGLEGSKFGEGSRDCLGPSKVKGGALVGDPGRRSPKAPTI